MGNGKGSSRKSSKASSLQHQASVEDMDLDNITGRSNTVTPAPSDDDIQSKMQLGMQLLSMSASLCFATRLWSVCLPLLCSFLTVHQLAHPAGKYSFVSCFLFLVMSFLTIIALQAAIVFVANMLTVNSLWLC